MYKDQLQGKKVEKENTKYTVLDEIKENEVPKAPENQEQQQVPETPERFSPSLYYLLMTGYGEPKCFEEAIRQKLERSGSKAWMRRWTYW